jgi:predicted nucleic acid-binding protein
VEHILVDTGFWIAAFDSRDNHYTQAQKKIELLELFEVVLPWPTLYETLRTRLVRNPIALQRFETFLKNPRVSFLDDTPLRDSALEIAIESSLRSKRPLSMVDCMIRLAIEDENINIDYLATFNIADFIDICARYSVEIL